MALPLRVCLATSIPGPNGSAGPSGSAGTNGTSATTQLTANYTMPGQGALGDATVGDATVFSIGEPIFLAVAGTMRVDGIVDAVTLSLRNLRDDGLLDYPNNAAAGVIIPSGAKLSPTGFQGAVGAIAGAAVGGDLTGTLPNPTLVIVGAAAVAGDATHSAVVTVDAKGRVLSAVQVPIAFPSGLSPSGPAGGDLTGTYPNPTIKPNGVLPGSYGTSAKWPIITVDLAGRLTSVVEVAAPLVLQRSGLLGIIIGAQMSITTDQNIPLASNKALITSIVMTNASVDISGMTIFGGIYDAVGKGGHKVVDTSQLWGSGMGLSANTKWMSPTLTAFTLSTLVTTNNLYFSLTSTSAGPTATTDIYVFGNSLS
jgi:hypothetical protein